MSKQTYSACPNYACVCRSQGEATMVKVVLFTMADICLQIVVFSMSKLYLCMLYSIQYCSGQNGLTQHGRYFLTDVFSMSKSYLFAVLKGKLQSSKLTQHGRNYVQTDIFITSKLYLCMLYSRRSCSLENCLTQRVRQGLCNSFLDVSDVIILSLSKSS